MRPLEEREVMDYRKSAQEVLDNIGGAGNVVSAAHCATRLRLVIADNAKVDKEALENIDGAKGVFEAQGQLQIIFGPSVCLSVMARCLSWCGSRRPCISESTVLITVSTLLLSSSTIATVWTARCT